MPAIGEKRTWVHEVLVRGKPPTETAPASWAAAHAEDVEEIWTGTDWLLSSRTIRPVEIDLVDDLIIAQTAGALAEATRAADLEAQLARASADNTALLERVAKAEAAAERTAIGVADQVRSLEAQVAALQDARDREAARAAGLEAALTERAQQLAALIADVSAPLPASGSAA